MNIFIRPCTSCPNMQGSLSPADTSSLCWHTTVIHVKTGGQGAFTPGSIGEIVQKQRGVSYLIRFLWIYVNTVIPLICRTVQTNLRSPRRSGLGSDPFKPCSGLFAFVRTQPMQQLEQIAFMCSKVSHQLTKGSIENTNMFWAVKSKLFSKLLSVVLVREPSVIKAEAGQQGWLLQQQWDERLSSPKWLFRVAGKWPCATWPLSPARTEWEELIVPQHWSVWSSFMHSASLFPHLSTLYHHSCILCPL